MTDMVENGGWLTSNVLLPKLRKYEPAPLDNTPKDDYIRYTWQQFGSEGETCKEGERIKNLKKEITKILGDRLMEFYYGIEKQSVYFKKK